MRRRHPVAFLVVAALLLPIGAWAAPTPSATPSGPAATPSSEAQDGGTVEGTVTSVDYQRGIVNVGTSHGEVTVTVMPSTSVQSSDPGYHAFSDVAKGAKVQILTSKADGKLVAQIIRILKR